jgi:hypothetical protein
MQEIRMFRGFIAASAHFLAPAIDAMAAANHYVIRDDKNTI